MRQRFSTGGLTLAAGALLGVFPSTLLAQSARLYVGNSIADNISVIDLNSSKVISAIRVGPHVHGMAGGWLPHFHHLRGRQYSPHL